MGKVGVEILPEEACESTEGNDAFEDAIDIGSVLAMSRGDNAVAGGNVSKGRRNATEIIRRWVDS